MNKIHISSLAVCLALTTSGCKDETQTAEMPPSAPKAEASAETVTQPTAEEGLIPTPEQQSVAQPAAEEESIPKSEPTPEPEPVPALVKAGGSSDVQHPYYAQLQHEREKYAAPTEGKHPLTSNLYNGEQVTLPDWLYDELADVNARLREKLTPSDYLQVLKGEQELLGHVKTKNMLQAHIRKTQDSSNTLYWYPNCGPNLNQPENLLAKLEQILENTDDDNTFARPRFLPPATKGIIYDGHLRYTPQDVVFSNERYVVSTSAGLSEGMSSVYHFWDTRTCSMESSCAIPTWVQNVPRYEAKGGEHFFCLQEMMGEAAGYTWDAVMYSSYILSPERMELQSNRTKGTMWDDAKKWTSEGQLSSRSPWIGSAVIDVEAQTRSEATAKNEDVTDPLRMLIPAPELGESNQLIQPIHHLHALALGYQGQKNYLLVDFNTLTHRRGFHNAASAAEKHMSAITQKVQPVPEGVEGTSDLTDVSEENQGCILFQYNGNTYDATSTDPSLLGLLTPQGDVKLFTNLGLAGNQLKFMPPSGKLISYKNALKPSTPEGEFNIKSSCSYECAPKVSNWHVYPSTENNKVLVFMSMNVQKNKNGTWIVEVDLNQDTFRVVHHWELTAYMLPAVWLPEKSMLLKPESDNCYAIIKIAEGEADKKLATMYVDVYQGYAIVLTDGRYAGSPGCESFLRFGDGKQVISLQALAPWRNRPGEVLEALEGNPDDIAALKQTTKRWLKKQGFDPNAMPEEPKLNELPMAEVEIPNLIAEQNSVSFKVKLRATARDIVRLDVRADGELLAQPSIQPDETAMGEREVTVTVPLATGQNWIEVTPVDAAGISGDSQKFRVIYKGTYESDLYVVALGVSDYDNDELDLNYAAKDARDLVAALEKHAGSRVRSLVLTDKEVTGAKVLDTIKGFLAGTTPDDRVVFYVAGHGMLDADLEYHYAPATFDPNRVKETGISMEEFTECMRACKARKRLLLLDTCHSGQLGEADEEKLAMLGVQLPHGVRAIQNRGMKVKKAKIELSEVQTKRYMEEIFTLGNTERGINIIAGAAGAEFALESGEWNNGVFTASIIKCLNGEVKADANDDKTLTVEELQMAVQDSVFALTGGRQKPSVVSAEDAYNFSIAIRDSKESTQAPENTQNSDSGGQVMTIAEQINPPAPTMEVEDRSSLDPLIARMAALRCKHATSKLYQQRLLTLLPLIRHGEDVNITLPETKGNTALHYSCAIGSLSITKWLLEHGANPNAVTDKGATPLQCVGADNGPQIRNLLKQYGAGNAVPAVQQTASYTHFSGGDRSSLDPLIARMAALRCRHATSKLYQQRLLTLLPLIRHGEDVNITLPETKGNTALHYSCAIGSLSITKWLLEHGANPNAVTDKGATPLQCVGADNGPQIRKLLKQYGAVR